MEGECGLLRTQEQIDSAVARAKLKPSDLLPFSQIITTSSEKFSAEHYRLLELDDHLLESLKSGKTISFKGNDDENVTLCTEKKTYDIRECETSNSLLLVSNLKFHKDIVGEKNISTVDIVGKNYKYIEVYTCKPSLIKIRKLLEETRYQGPEVEYDIDESKLMSYEDLLEKSQASDAELEQSLLKLNTLVVNGKIRVLDLNYHFRVLSYMLKSIDENSWDPDEIEEGETVSAWSEIVPEEILEQLFRFYTEKSKIKDGVQLYRYDERKVCRFLGLVLLRHGDKYNMEHFFQLWSESVPEGMVPTEDMLYGVAVVDKNVTPNKIWEFLEDKLPETIDGRFQALFAEKSKWTIPEITPYILSLTTDKLDANAILSKYTRASTVDGVRYYSAKYI